MQKLYRSDQWTLPAPAFPFVTDDTDDPLWKLVRSSQAAMLSDTVKEGESFSFAVRDDITPIPFVGDDKERTLQTVRGLCHFAQLYLVPLTSKTLARGRGFHPAWYCRAIAPFVHMTVSTKQFERFVSGLEKIDRLTCANWIADQAAWWIDLRGIAKTSEGFDGLFYTPYEDVLKRYTDDWAIDFL